MISQLPKSSDPTSTNSLLRKADRRPRQNRFNTVGGSDSGYASTGDENRLSHEMIMSKGSLEEINESCNVSTSPNSTSTTNRLILDREASGDLAKEVMLAYAETIIEKKMAARGAPLSPPSLVTSPTTAAAAAMDVSNNNIPVKKKIIPQHIPISKLPESKIAPKAAVEEISDESQTSDADFESPKSNEKTKMNNNNLSPALSVTSTSSSSDSSELQTPLNPTQKAASKPSTAPSKLGISKSVSIRSGTAPPESKPSAVKKVTVSRIQPTTTTTTTMRSAMPKSVSTTATSGIKKPSLSTSKIAPAPTSTNIPPRKSDPTQAKSTSSRLTTSTINLSRTTKSIDSNVAPNGTLRKQQQPTLNSMSKSAISGTTLANRKPAAIGSQPNLANGSTTGSLVDTMRKVIEGKLAGTKLPIDKDRLSQELSSGVYLCNFANKIRIRAVPTIFTPSEANLSPLKAKRNADGFVAACKRLGVPEILQQPSMLFTLLTNSLCTSTDIIERNNLLQIARTVLALNKLALSNGSVTTVIASRV
uniref:Calponin-homology (CH) domain-containing protein n=1 Tax=Panagrolaimus davidi TaxID=227884 RepID=A0A914QKG2_9BILA